MKWCPLATIWVPMSTARSEAAKRRSVSMSAPRLGDGVGIQPEALQLRDAFLQLAFEPLGPGADRASSAEPHSGQASGMGSTNAQW